MTLVFFIFLCIQIIGFPLVGIKLIRSIYRKEATKIKKNSIWLIALLLFSGFVFEILPGSKYFWWPMEAVESKNYTKNLTGISFILPEPLYQPHSERHFNGDGSSCTIYKLNEGVIAQLITPDSVFFTQYPKKGAQKDWEIERWTRTPLRKEHQEAFDFVAHAEHAPQYDLNEILAEAGNYYAFKYYKHSSVHGSDYFGNMDFYIMSPRRQILIVINVNT